MTDSGNTKQPTILEEAAQIITNDREKTYGNPAANLDRIRAIWQQVLGVEKSRCLNVR